MPTNSVLILGIGNNLLSDEGVGIHAINYLQQRLPSSNAITLLDGGTLSFTLATVIEESNHLIVIDAAQLNQSPGTCQTFINADMDHFLGTTKRSVHEVGLLDLLDISRLANHLPKNRALIGIQPKILTWGENLSPAVAPSLEIALNKTKELLHLWSIV
ncbi:MAG: HyaD/HybD family hydrogenase maturation endopeptidase [Methylococcales bacterium]|jgi:hydrogenase maturation protease|nr:HyaD/HybD family hydrogenase maturation endopeptidase [Methylococcales bacterium]